MPFFGYYLSIFPYDDEESTVSCGTEMASSLFWDHVVPYGLTSENIQRFDFNSWLSCFMSK